MTPDPLSDHLQDLSIGSRTPLRYPISLLLALLIAVPLAGAAWFAIDDTRQASAQRSQATTVDTSTRRLVALTELRAQLLDERNWFSAIGSVNQLGVDLAFVETFIGINLLSELERSQGQVDALFIELDMPEIDAELQSIRADDTIDFIAVAAQYDEIEARLNVESEQTLDSLMERAGALDEADQLITSLRVLNASTEARQAISDEITTFFSAQFSGTVSSLSQLNATIEQRAVRASAEEDIRRLAIDGSNVHVTIRMISESPEAALFDESVADLLATRLEAENGDIEAVLDDIGGVVDNFTSSIATTNLYFELVDAAGTDTLDASDALSANAADQQRQALVGIAALGVVSLLIGFAATRAIRRPVRLLSQVASRISAGDSSARFSNAGGPVEIRSAGRALDDAAEHLHLAEQQTKALADGELDHPVLSHQNAGELGAALQNAVGALATSMQEREEFRRRMTHEATHDGLTGIANRNASLAQLNRGLARTRRSEASLAVLFIDLDDFKAVNDNHGHRAGDAVLRTIAQRMVNTVRAGDHVGRLGGDEFVVIAEPVEDMATALELAERLLDALAKPILCDGAMLAVGASIGVSMSDDFTKPVDEQADGTELLRDADLAVYKAKSEGRGRIELCDDDLRAAMLERADLEKALRQAIDDNEFLLHYQPIVKPPDDSLHGFEALIRWNRPAKGMVPPDDFIPFAERSDLIVLIDQWVLGAVARQIRTWDIAGRYPDLPISINISGRHLASPDFVEDVMSPLQDAEIDPQRIIIEITESALLEDLDGAASKLQALRSHGIRTAIDDFGTGYTSLAHLKSLPIDILKIDRSFTNDESAASLVQLIIDTGHLLGATITAEGIETRLQADSLTAMGSDDLQGYLYGRPCAAEGLELPRGASTKP